MKRAVVKFDPAGGGVIATCPYCGKETPRARNYYGSGKGSHRCGHCYCLYKVAFAGVKQVRK